MEDYIRFQSATPNRHGRFPGVFAMANGLAKEHLLRAHDAQWLQSANTRANAAYPDPALTGSECYNLDRFPGARAWFKATATHLLEMTGEYLELLDRYDVPWMELRTARPGRVVYEDNVQVVTTPFGYPADWPFSR
ncbi:hypothetical protein [Allobranchiibius sp. CTAmp26]|uniref:hypothetical protein n=1 Tax=Allobranchiibius sp. CTAmp26 TaxID=2815214 RepID=UPI001AA1191E|nr:hypothetical protein [Allobranchiibius sp. CTAmp26]MBO1756816.1 hypothetical protein [Allobranchiibius sp. CTAmp26]